MLLFRRLLMIISKFQTESFDNGIRIDLFITCLYEIDTTRLYCLLIGAA